MKQKFNQGGRPPKLNPATYRYVVRFDAAENGVFLSLFEKSGATNKANFIKGVLLGKPFKVFVVDENTRIFIDKLSALNARYRTFAIDYDLLVNTLRENFSEKKAMQALYKLEQITIDMVKVNKEIVALARQFDNVWKNKKAPNFQVWHTCRPFRQAACLSPDAAPHPRLRRRASPREYPRH